MKLIKMAIEGHLDQSEELILSMEEIDELQNKADTDEVLLMQDIAEVDKTMNVVEALEDLAFIAASEEKITPKEAALIQIATDATMLGTGADASVIFPAMEDITSGTTISNRIKEVIKRILAEVVRIIGVIKKKIVEFLTAHGKLIKQRRLQIKKLQSLLGTVDDNGISDKKFKAKPLYFVNSNDDVHICSKISDIISQLAAHSDGVEKYLNTANDYVRTVVDIAGNFYKAVQSNNEPLTASYASMLATDRIIKDFGKLRDSKKNGRNFEITGGLLGGGLATVEIGSKSVKSDAQPNEIAPCFRENLTDLRVHIGSKSAPVDPIQMKVLPRHEAWQLLKLSMRLVDMSDRIHNTLTARQEDIATLIRVIEKTAHLESVTGDINSKLPYLNITTSVVRSLESIPVNAFSGLYSLNARITNQVIRIVSDSIEASTAVKQ